MLLMFSGNDLLYGQCGSFNFPNGVILNTPADANSLSAVVSSNTTTFGGDIIINNGVVFSITAATLRFDSDASIIVNSGGTLISGVTLFTSCDPGGYWQGIQVRGFYDALYSSSLQGTLLLKQSTVENAVIGASNFNLAQSPGNPTSAGGKIISYSSFFHNCNQAVVLGTYLHPNAHIFDRTLFDWDNNFNFTFDDGAKPMFVNYENTNVRITGCNFINTNANLFYEDCGFQRAAIYLRGQDASILMNPITVGNNYYPSEIKGFAYGMWHNGTGASRVNGVKFSNFRDFYLRSKATEVSACTFSNLYPTTFQLLASNVDPDDITVLENVLGRENYGAAGMALTMLQNYNGYVYDEYIPEIMADKSFDPNPNVFKPTAEDISPKIEVFPNPASDYIVINNPEPDEQITAFVYNVKGELVLSERLGTGFQAILDITKLNTGSFQLELKSNGKRVLINPIEVIK